MRLISWLLFFLIGAGTASYTPFKAHIPPYDEMRSIALDALPGLEQYLPESIPGSEALVSGLTVNEAIGLLESYSWDIEPSIDGERSIIAKVGEINTVASLLDCEEQVAAPCKTLLIFANFSLGSPVTEDIKNKINAFNDNQAVARGYFLEATDDETGQVGLDMRINLEGGVSRAHLDSEAEKWPLVVDEFISDFSDESS